MDERQWLALREFAAIKLQMHAGAAPRQYELPGGVMYVDATMVMPSVEALLVLDAQLQWISAGHRSTSSKAP